MKPMTLTLVEYQILEDRFRHDFKVTGQRDAEAKLEKAFRRLWRHSKGGSMITKRDALELVNIDFIELFDRDGSIKQWREAPPHMIVFRREPIR